MSRISFDDLAKLAVGLSKVDVNEVRDLVEGIVSDDLITEKERIGLVSLVCSDRIVVDPEWSLLAGRVQIWDLRRQVSPTFSGAMTRLRATLDPEFYAFVSANTEALESMIVPERDYKFNVFAAKTLLTSYLSKSETVDAKGKSTFVTEETPNYLYLRVATFIHFPRGISANDFWSTQGVAKIQVADGWYETIKRAYDDLSSGSYSHASPTLFNAGCVCSQMASCFLLDYGSKLEDYTRAWHDMAFISEHSGGIGTSMSTVPERNNGGGFRGLVPNAKTVEPILGASDQGGKRKGNGTMYCAMFHAEISSFIELRDDGAADIRAPGLFYGVMVPDLFMKRASIDSAENPMMWSLFCPSRNPELFELYGAEFEKAYEAAEAREEFTSQVLVKSILDKLLTIQIKKGMPFVIYSDHVNRKSNQINSGVVKCSNLCTEIVQVTSKDEIASCNLASINLADCVVVPPASKSPDGSSEAGSLPQFDFQKLERLSGDLVRNLNQIIDRNYYPDHTPQIKNSNLRHRPLGIGVQGFANTLAMLDVCWVDLHQTKNSKGETVTIQTLNAEAKKLNSQIFETIYFGCVKASMELARVQGPYPSFPGSPTSKGLFQMDLWETVDFQSKNGDLAVPTPSYLKGQGFSRYSPEMWEGLRRDMMKYGLRNSLLVALMPTATSAQLLDNNEAFEVFHELISNRSVMSGQHTIVNRHMVEDLSAIGLWNHEVMEHIIENGSTLAKLDEYFLARHSREGTTPNPLTEARLRYLQIKYLTVFEVSQKPLLQLAADRSRFVCQTSSMNLFMARPTKTSLWQCLHFAWTKGLKTGMYYLRTKSSTNPRDMTKSGATPASDEKTKSGATPASDEKTKSASSETKVETVAVAKIEKPAMKEKVEITSAEKVCASTEVGKIEANSEVETSPNQALLEKLRQVEACSRENKEKCVMCEV